MVHEYIRRRLQAIGRSQSELAEALGVTPSAISKWLAPSATPPVGQWPRMEQFLGLPKGSIEKVVEAEDALSSAASRFDQSISELMEIAYELSAFDRDRLIAIARRLYNDSMQARYGDFTLAADEAQAVEDYDGFETPRLDPDRDPEP
jgi:transcriptional regulator with XRE-family HTH domain